MESIDKIQGTFDAKGKEAKPAVSDAVIKRLPRYHRYLGELIADGRLRISSAELSQIMNVTASQIRQDLNCFGGFGQQGYGYNVQSLRDAIAGILGIDKGHNAILVGVGNIGRALMCNFDFETWGFKLCCGFDTNPERIGESYNGIPVLDDNDLENYLRDNPVDVAVLTVPKTVAAPVAKQLADCGVKAIWNFTNVEIELPRDKIIVENMHFSDSLLALSYHISRAED